MDRRQLVFVILINAFVSLVIALAVAWVIDARRPDLEALAAQFTPMPAAIIASTATATRDGAALSATTPDPVAEPAAGAVDSEPLVYIVQAGDSLSSIAARYQISLDTLVSINGLTDPNFVFSGQRLVIPADAEALSAIEAEQDVADPTKLGEPQIAAVENLGVLQNEAVLIVNESDAPIDLAGWQLAPADGPVYTFDSLPLFAGSSVRVYSTSGDDNSIARYWGLDETLWQSGAEVRLVDGAGAIVDTFRIP